MIILTTERNELSLFQADNVWENGFCERERIAECIHEGHHNELKRMLLSWDVLSVCRIKTSIQRRIFQQINGFSMHDHIRHCQLDIIELEMECSMGLRRGEG